MSADDTMKCGHKEHRYQGVDICLDCAEEIEKELAILKSQLAAAKEALAEKDALAAWEDKVVEAAKRVAESSKHPIVDSGKALQDIMDLNLALSKEPKPQEGSDDEAGG